ncbi:MAG: hypothetical protein COA47_11420 [Robiginitomaculum sp.]|nr:MAG: hypothetical protein COA47_11420 [Robiginitomaculum sp.]
MQLTRKKNRNLAGLLGAMTASLLAGGVHAQSDTLATINQDNPTRPEFDSGLDDRDTYTDEGLTRLDSAVLVYQEDGGRVQAIEPVFGVTFNNTDGSALSLQFTADVLTGASPFGATPWKGTQTFVAGIKPGDDGGTGASGSAVVTPGANGLSIVSTDVDPNQLPLASGFNDKRYAVDISYSKPWGKGTTANIGAGGSFETDYTAIYGNIGFSKDMNQKNTTITVSGNFEFDTSKPSIGNPTSFDVMSGDLKNGNRDKTTVGGLIGITQTMNRRWLAQLNYTVTKSDGYQTDPYRIISVVDHITGGPNQYLYESRPESRTRQSIYFGNKISIGDMVTNISVRGYHDNWGIDSLTLKASQHIPLGRSLYIEPGIRYYTQSGADFFRYFLQDNEALPQFASADSRLDSFSAITPSLLIGYKIGRTGEVYARFSHYKPSGKDRQANAPGYLAGRDLFSGATSNSIIVGYSYAFR